MRCASLRASDRSGSKVIWVYSESRSLASESSGIKTSHDIIILLFTRNEWNNTGRRKNI